MSITNIVGVYPVGDRRSEMGEQCDHEVAEYVGVQEGYKELPAFEIGNCIKCHSSIDISKYRYFYTRDEKDYYQKVSELEEKVE